MTPTDTATVELTLADAPAIPGLRFRQFRDASDWAPLADLQKAVAIADRDDEIPSAENLRIDVENKPGYVIARDLLIAEVDGRSRFRRWHCHDPRRPCRPLPVRPRPSRLAGGGASVARCFAGTSGALETAQSPSPSSPAGARPRVVGERVRARCPGSLRVRGIRGRALRLHDDPSPRAGRRANPHAGGHRTAPGNAGPAPPDLRRRRRGIPGPLRVPGGDRAGLRCDLQPAGHRHLAVEGRLGRRSDRGLRAALHLEGGERDAWREACVARERVDAPTVASARAGAGVDRGLPVELRERGIEEALLGVDAENPTGALALYEGLGFEVKLRSMSYRKALET